MARRNIGTFVGVFGGDWLETALQDQQDSSINRVLAFDFALANRIFQAFDLTGPR